MNRLENLDYKDFLKSIEDNSVDFVLTDPPYELDNDGGTGDNCFSNRDMINTNVKSIDYISNGFDIDYCFNEIIRIQKIVNAVIFCSNKQVGKIMTWWEKKGYVATILVWRKTNPIPLCNGNHVSEIEFMIFVRGKGATFNQLSFEELKKVYDYPYPSKSERIHPTEKPLRILRRLLRIHSKKNDIVLDLFAGSFTTAIACHREERFCWATDNDTKMYNKAMRRYNEEINQLGLF